MVPYEALFATTTFSGSRRPTAVVSSLPVIRNPPSPQNACTCRVGWRRLAAKAAGTPMPIAPQAAASMVCDGCMRSTRWIQVEKLPASSVKIASGCKPVATSSMTWPKTSAAGVWPVSQPCASSLALAVSASRCVREGKAGTARVFMARTKAAALDTIASAVWCWIANAAASG